MPGFHFLFPIWKSYNLLKPDLNDLANHYMRTTDTIPEAPAITNERLYIEWFVQYSDKTGRAEKPGRPLCKK